MQENARRQEIDQKGHIVNLITMFYAFSFTVGVLLDLKTVWSATWPAYISKTVIESTFVVGFSLLQSRLIVYIGEIDCNI